MSDGSRDRAPRPDLPWDVTEDRLLAGRVRLLQPSRGHRAGTDAVLLAAAVRAAPGMALVDVGAATGAVGLMVLGRVPDIDLTLVERDPDLAELAGRNLALNRAGGRVVVADILDPGSRRAGGLMLESADVVATNPPFLEENRARISPDPGRARAHALVEGGLDLWLRACGSLLRPKGQIALIHRADRLRDCLAIEGTGFGGLRLRFIHPKADRPAVRLVVTAVKGSRAPLSVEPPLVLHGADGRFTPEAEAVHRGDMLL
jgi:tRNA1(Val) A37 N6-methylase TrmN6